MRERDTSIRTELPRSTTALLYSEFQLLHECLRECPRGIGDNNALCRNSAPEMFAVSPLLIDRVWQRILWAVFPLAQLYWRLARKKRSSALVAVYVGQELVLLRSSYRTSLNFPGGQLRYGETPEGAAKRELMEEIGLCVTAGLFYAGSTVDRVHFFELRLSELPRFRLDNREIIGIQLVPIEKLGGLDLTKSVRAYIEGHIHQFAQS